MAARHTGQKGVVLPRPAAALAVLLAVSAAGCGGGRDEAREQGPDGPASERLPIPSGTVNGVNGQVGEVLLRDVSFDEPPDRSYDSGDVVRLRFTVFNQAERPDALLGVQTPVASRTTLLYDRDCDGDTEQIDRLQLEGQADVRTPAPGRPDGRERRPHVEVLLEKRLLAGEIAPVTFRFRNAGSTTLQVPVELTGQRNLVDPQPNCGTGASPTTTPSTSSTS